MSENTKLTSEQAKVVRELEQARSAFGDANPFQPDSMRERVADVVVKFRELEALFPQFAKEAAEYFHAEIPEYLEETEGYGDALFEVLLDLHAFNDAQTFNRLVHASNCLQNSIYDLCTFSDEYHVERGCWKDELA